MAPLTLADADALGLSVAAARLRVKLERLKPENRPRAVVGLKHFIKRNVKKPLLYIVHPERLLKVLGVSKVTGAEPNAGADELLESLISVYKERLDPKSVPSDLLEGELPEALVARVRRTMECLRGGGQLGVRAFPYWLLTQAYYQADVPVDRLLQAFVASGFATVGGDGRLEYAGAPASEDRACPTQALSCWTMHPPPLKLKEAPITESIVAILPPPETWFQFIEVEASLTKALAWIIQPRPYIILLPQFVGQAHLAAAESDVRSHLSDISPFEIAFHTLSHSRLSYMPASQLAATPTSYPEGALHTLQDAVAKCTPQVRYQFSPQIGLGSHHDATVAQAHCEKYQNTWKPVKFAVRHVFVLEKLTPGVRHFAGGGKGKGKRKGNGRHNGRGGAQDFRRPWAVAAAIPLGGVPLDEEPLLKVGSLITLAAQAPAGARRFQRLLWQLEAELHELDPREGRLEMQADAREFRDLYRWGYKDATEFRDLYRWGYTAEDQLEEGALQEADKSRASKGTTNAERRHQHAQHRHQLKGEAHDFKPRRREQQLQDKRAASHASHLRDDEKSKWSKARNRARDLKVQGLSRTISSEGSALSSAGAPPGQVEASEPEGAQEVAGALDGKKGREKKKRLVPWDDSFEEQAVGATDDIAPSAD